MLVLLPRPSQDSAESSMPWSHHSALCCWPLSCNLMTCSTATHTTLTIISRLLMDRADADTTLQMHLIAKRLRQYLHATRFLVSTQTFIPQDMHLPQGLLDPGRVSETTTLLPNPQFPPAPGSPWTQVTEPDFFLWMIFFPYGLQRPS